ncbi:homoserine kinase [Massilia sp. PWRC2]|uniref:homoserine kinase n=1 Tax=Massilia sp. PWRC2 TaxID=2804626 RepID=UPI003CF8CA17
MAVFTAVSLDDLTPWIEQFPLGKASALQGIASGIENSNFFLSTDSGEFVLTLFENLSFEQLPFYLELMRHLASGGVLVPAPVATRSGTLVADLHGKPAAIVSKLEGRSQMAPTPVHCAAVGAMLARMHLVGRDFPLSQPNLRGLSWWIWATPQVLPNMDDASATLLCSEMRYQIETADGAAHRALPCGPIHADLFRNNVMFDGEQLTGFFDFYFAGCDAWLFDLAVTVNDWCVDQDSGALDLARLHAMVDAYHAVRPFVAAERSVWQAMLRAAALRFWLSRLHDLHQPRAAEMLTPHDPTHFERILRERITVSAPELP